MFFLVVHGFWVQSLIDLNSIISELNCSCYFLFSSYRNPTQSSLDKERLFVGFGVFFVT